MARPAKNLTEKIWGEWFPFITIGVGLSILTWVYVLGDLVMGRG